MGDMLKFLGSGSAFNAKRGNTSGYMEFAGELFLFDAGNDVFGKLMKLNLLEKKARVNIFITHLHSDHVGSLGTIIDYLYFKVYKQDMSNICVYFPSEAIADLLAMQGVPRDHYNLFVNKWDELYLPTLGRKQPEYAFYETGHTANLDYEGHTNTYSIEFMLENEFSFFYSGDTAEYHEKLQNIYLYDQIYHEVTMMENSDVHMSYERLLEKTSHLSKEERSRFHLMHLEEEFDIERAKVDGFQIVENIEIM